MPRDSIKLYLGIKANQEWMLIFGGKIAGVKILIPWTNPYNWGYPFDQQSDGKPKTQSSQERIAEQI